MTDNNHPITPPPQLFAEWIANSMKTVGRTIPENDRGATGLIAGEVVIQAARWGADQELEACVHYVDNVISGNKARALRAIRRPKPPSLKEQALAVLVDASNRIDAAHENIIRRAIESLPD